ncbi:potassium channel family protein [Streptomyces sp. YIM 98790]|uniref:potassium channel family protein n=1 Tax=Streptomyces sp. YIM 98790 TaxID=2689077 RepID=UPI00140B2C35|nr:potassium channel family protein [Streptomyces sp. YIM 98790]
MKWLVVAAGAALVALALRDLFHTLWHPTRRGGVSRLVMRTLWRLLRRFAGGHLAGLTGPLGMALVVLTWGSITILGWALIYWPFLPDGFIFSDPLEPQRHDGLVEAVYVSMVMVATLGLGDIAPAEDWLRIVLPLESLIGFMLLSAVVSWVLGVYPAIGRRRALATRLHLLHRQEALADALDRPAAAGVLDGLAAEVLRVRVDFTQYPEAYYFHDTDDRLSLAAAVEDAWVLARRAAGSAHPEVRLAGGMLTDALEDLAAVLDRSFLHTGGDPAGVFAAYADDHGSGGG